LTCELEGVEAVRFVGAVGGVVSTVVITLKEAVVEDETDPLVPLMVTV